jgi:hypothetical protein
MFRSHPKFKPLAQHLPLLFGFWLGLTGLSSAIVLLDTDNASANTTTPTGLYADSGWGFQGEYGGFLGTMVGQQYFITAQHFGVQGSTFVSTAKFNGVADVTYTIDASANGGAGFWDIAGTDLRVFKVNESFSTWAEIYTGSSEVGNTMVTFGRGGPRGAEVTVGPTVHGWHTTGMDGVSRWGANEVSGIVSSGVGDLISAQFNNVSGQNEATLSSGDSGGGVFIQVGAQWFLAGINYAVDGFFDTNSTVGDFSEFDAALFDKGGFFEGSDGTGWSFHKDTGLDKPSSMYASRISTSSTEILSIVAVPEPGSLTPLAVPEPGSLTLLAMAGVVMLRRRRVV